MRRYYPPTDSDIPLHGFAPYHEFHRERIRAHAKHDGNEESMERKEWLDRAWMEVLVEEVGEVAKELNDARHNGVFPTGVEYVALRDRLRKELVQCGAMIAAWVEAVDEDRCDEKLQLSRPTPEGDIEVECSLRRFHEGQHHDWSGRYKWA